MDNVPPTVADADAQACLNRVVDVADQPDVRVARAAERLALAESLYHTGSITEAEYAEHEKFHGKCVAAATSVVADGAPAWFGPAVTVAVGPAVTAAVKAAMGPAVTAAVKAAMAPLLARLDNIEARHHNTVADEGDPFQVIRNGDGLVSHHFPQNMAALVAMDERAMTSFLQHYGEPVPKSNSDKRQKIRAFIGLRPIVLE